MTEGWLLDTNVVSELARTLPEPLVVAFVSKLDEIVLPAIVVYELERGVRALPAGRRRHLLTKWLDARLAPPVIVAPLDLDAARAAADVETAAARRGQSIEVRDALIVGIARARGMGIATRNIAHLGGHGVPVVNPFVA